jgi:hypothetical protein
MERSEGDMSLKILVTPPEIDPGTVRLVAERLNHYATPGPLIQRALDYILTISFGYILYCVCFNLFCNVWVCGVCMCMCGFCNVWVFW